MCAYCGEENEIELDPGDGERQKLYGECNGCGRTSVVIARYNFHSNEFDLTIEREPTQ